MVKNIFDREIRSFDDKSRQYGLRAIKYIREKQ